MKALSDRARATRPTVPTSVSLAAWRDKEVIPTLVTAAADVATLAARHTALLELSASSNAAIDHAETQLEVARREVGRLTLLSDAVAAEIPKLEASERAAKEAAISEKSAADAETLAFRKWCATYLDDTFARLAEGLTLWHKLRATRSNWYRRHQVLPALVRAEVSMALVPDAIFAQHQGAGNLDQCVLVLPAFADPDGQTAPRPRHWPPVPPRAPALAKEPRPEAEPYVPRGRIERVAGTPAPTAPPMGPKGLQLDPTYADGAARALA